MTSPTVRVHFLPNLVDEAALADSAVVVIDILRASTTISHALAAGAHEVIPCLHIDEARQIASLLSSSESAAPVVLGGERGGLPIAGFDLGNSPSEYTPAAIAGKTLVFTTTNGTKAMQRCRKAQRVYIGAFANLSAVVAALRDAPRVDLVCAGTRGEITREDVLFAGAVVAQLVANDSARLLNDQARIALECWEAVVSKTTSRRIPTAEELGAALQHTQGGRSLAAIGLQSDLVDAAKIDSVSHVAELDIAAWRITS